MMKKTILFFAPALLLCLLWSCGAKEETAQADVLRPVRYLKIAPAEGSIVRTFSGAARPSTKTKLSFKIGGTLQQLNAKVGQKVRAGQLIAMLDPSDYELQYEEADAAVKMADAQEKNAKFNYERVALLYENESVSLSEYESARAAFNSAQAQEKSAKQRRKLAESHLSYTRLYAPEAGIIAEVMVEQNENIQPGQTIVEVDAGSEIEVEVSVPETVIGAIHAGDEVAMRFSAIAGNTFKGIVSEVAFSLGRQDKSYPVVIRVQTQDDRMRPGMAVEVSFSFREATKEVRIVIPAKCVLEDQDGRFVYTVENDPENQYAVVKRSAVVVKDFTGQGIVIEKGLAIGDKIVTAGMSQVSNGMKVKMLNERGG